MRALASLLLIALLPVFSTAQRWNKKCECEIDTVSIIAVTPHPAAYTVAGKFDIDIQSKHEARFELATPTLAREDEHENRHHVRSSNRHMAAHGGTWRHMAAHSGTERHIAEQSDISRHPGRAVNARNGTPAASDRPFAHGQPQRF